MSTLGELDQLVRETGSGTQPEWLGKVSDQRGRTSGEVRQIRGARIVVGESQEISPREELQEIWQNTEEIIRASVGKRVDNYSFLDHGTFYVHQKAVNNRATCELAVVQMLEMHANHIDPYKLRSQVEAEAQRKRIVFESYEPLLQMKAQQLDLAYANGILSPDYDTLLATGDIKNIQAHNRLLDQFAAQLQAQDQAGEIRGRVTFIRPQGRIGRLTEIIHGLLSNERAAYGIDIPYPSDASRHEVLVGGIEVSQNPNQQEPRFKITDPLGQGIEDNWITLTALFKLMEWTGGIYKATRPAEVDQRRQAMSRATSREQGSPGSRIVWKEAATESTSFSHVLFAYLRLRHAQSQAHPEEALHVGDLYLLETMLGFYPDSKLAAFVGREKSRQQARRIADQALLPLKAQALDNFLAFMQTQPPEILTPDFFRALYTFLSQGFDPNLFPDAAAMAGELGHHLGLAVPPARTEVRKEERRVGIGSAGEKKEAVVPATRAEPQAGQGELDLKLPLFDLAAKALKEKGIFEKELSDQELSQILAEIIASLMAGQKGIKASVPTPIIQVVGIIERGRGVVAGSVHIKEPIKATIETSFALVNDTVPRRIRSEGFKMHQRAGLKEKVALMAYNIEGRAKDALKDPNQAFSLALGAQLKSRGVKLTKLGLHFNNRTLAVSLRGQPVLAKR